MSVVIAIDAGTTGVRAFAVPTRTARPAGFAYREFTQHFPQPGWVEHDAAEIWAGRAGDAGRAGRDGSTEPIAAVGITDQRETVVAWDRRTGQPLHRAIVWQDRRTAARCDALREAGPRAARPGRHRPRARPVLLGHQGGVAPHRGRRGGRRPTSPSAPIDAWVLWNLTGGRRRRVFATEPSNASRTMLFDIRTLAWSDELLDLFGVPAAALPEVRPSSGRFGTTADGCGLPRRHPGVGHRRRPAGRAVRPGLPRARA